MTQEHIQAVSNLYKKFPFMAYSIYFYRSKVQDRMEKFGIQYTYFMSFGDTVIANDMTIIHISEDDGQLIYTCEKNKKQYDIPAEYISEFIPYVTQHSDKNDILRQLGQEFEHIVEDNGYGRKYEYDRPIIPVFNNFAPDNTHIDKDYKSYLHNVDMITLDLLDYMRGPSILNMIFDEQSIIDDFILTFGQPYYCFDFNNPKVVLVRKSAYLKYYVSGKNSKKDPKISYCVLSIDYSKYKKKEKNQDIIIKYINRKTYTWKSSNKSTIYNYDYIVKYDDERINSLTGLGLVFSTKSEYTKWIADKKAFDTALKNTTIEFNRKYRLALKNNDTVLKQEMLIKRKELKKCTSVESINELIDRKPEISDKFQKQKYNISIGNVTEALYLSEDEYNLTSKILKMAERSKIITNISKI